MKYLTVIRHVESFRESGPPQALMDPTSTARENATLGQRRVGTGGS